MDRVLVTGGAGFIGSHLTERLIGEGHEVVVLDSLATGRLENLAHLSGHPRLRFQRVDVANFDEIHPLFTGVRRVFHLAALADIVPSIQKPLLYHRANVEGTASVLEASRRARVHSVVYAASSSCYGVPDLTPTPESSPMQPLYPYALTKRLGEEIAMHWAHTYRMRVISLRLFNVYGPRSRTSGAYGAVLGVFLAQKLAGKPFTVVGDGMQTRDFTYVTDVADAFVKASESDLSGRVFNVGSGGTYSIKRLVELLGGPVVHIPKRPGEPDSTFADTTAIEQALGWRARISFEEGVRRVLEHIGDWEGAPVWTPDTILEATHEWFECLTPQETVQK
ncbi:MAG: SDR family oxidoreductase [Candidatus Omnitrophica bacterium]|nr:SDR family oxidoreductase [Candidatus Omnitrophota bacterium]